MRVLDNVQQLEMLCKLTGKAGMYVYPHFPDGSDVLDVWKAAPWMNREDTMQIALDGGIVLFDTYDEMQEAYWATVGDDGPTKTNSYNGPVRVYALTCNADGQCENENT